MPKRCHRIAAASASVGCALATAEQATAYPRESDELLAETPTWQVAGEELAGLSIDEALADLGIGRKAWRRLRAELHLENDLFASVLSRWRCDQRGCEAALRRVLPAPVALATAGRLDVAAEVCRAADALQHPSQWSCVAAAAGEVSPGAAGQERPRWGWEGVQARLPRMPPGMSTATEGQEERRRALRRRLQLMLPADGNAAVKALSAEFRLSGPAGASDYLRAVWLLLEPLEDAAEELLAELICTQVEPDTQRALRSALAAECDSGRRSGEFDGVSKHRPPTRPVDQHLGGRRCSLLLLPEPQVLQALFFCASASSLCAVGAASRDLRALAEQDFLWQGIWLRHRSKDGAGPPPASDVRQHFLRRLACQCVQCRQATDFEHAILGCRLCEACERSFPQYALIRVRTAVQEYQLSLDALRALPHVDGATGRVYLRTAVQALADRRHSREGLKVLRARHDVGITSEGRQRKRDQPRGQQMSEAKEVRGRVFKDDDPCCFEATALRRANDHDQLITAGMMADWRGGGRRT